MPILVQWENIFLMSFRLLNCRKQEFSANSEE